MRLNPADLLRAAPERMETPRMPMTGARSQSMQRLQVGLFGLGTMVLLIGLANIIGHNAEENASVVAESAPTAAAGPDVAPIRDPLADAGVVPDLPADDVEAPPPGPDAPSPQP